MTLKIFKTNSLHYWNSVALVVSYLCTVYLWFQYLGHSTFTNLIFIYFVITKTLLDLINKNIYYSVNITKPRECLSCDNRWLYMRVSVVIYFFPAVDNNQSRLLLGKMHLYWSPWSKLYIKMCVKALETADMLHFMTKCFCQTVSQLNQPSAHYAHYVCMTLYTVGYSRSMGRLHNKCACLSDSARITTHTYPNIFRQTKTHTHTPLYTYTHTHPSP